MLVLRRLALAVSMFLCLSVSFTAAAIATDAHALSRGSIGAKGGGGGGGLLPAGNYHNTNVFAGYSVCCSGPQLSVNVTANTNDSNPRVGPTTSQHEVDVNFQACDFVSGVCGAGCFIPDGASDFTVNSSLSSAVLNTTVTDTTLPCQGNPVFGLPRPFSVNVTWTAVGSFSESSGVGRYACGGYTSETLTTTNFSTATHATASTTLLSGTFPVSGANLGSFDQRIHAQGTPLDSCTPLGGKGAGGGPLAAGNYHFVSQQANVSIVPTDPSQASINMFVNRFTNVSRPTGGPSTTLNETDLNIFQSTFPPSIQGCFIIPSNAFTVASNLQSASLHVAIDSTTPPCPQGNNSGFPASFTVDATWSGTGPTATFKTDGTSACASFHTVSSSSQAFSNASASGGVSGIADSFSSTQASMGTSDTTTHIQGTQTCF